MGDKLATTAVAANRQEEKSSSVVQDTARAFLRRHSDPASLLRQLKTLYLNGAYANCKSLIQMICEEVHPLCELSELHVLHASIAFEQDDQRGLSQSVRQAEIQNRSCPELARLRGVLAAQELLRDGCYEKGLGALGALTSGEKVNAHASFLLGYHQLFKSSDLDAAILNLQNAVNERPGFIRAWIALGLALNRAGQPSRAQEAFWKCIELESDPEKQAKYRQYLAS